MVLGIDEYLNKKSKDKEIDFIAFKKYYHMSPMTFLKKMNYEEKNE